MSDFEYNFSTKNLSLISGSIEQVDTFDPRIDSDTNDFIRMRVYNQDNQNTAMEVFQTNIFNEDGTPQIKVYEDNSDNDNNTKGKFFLKPNEVLEKANIPNGTYRLKFDFLRNIFANKITLGVECDENNQNTCNPDYGFLYFSQNNDGVTPFNNPHFLSKDISNSGREIRLLERSDDDVNPFSFWGDMGSIYADYFTEILGNPLQNQYKYNFHLVYNVSQDPIQILNYVFDEYTNPGYRNLVLKLANGQISSQIGRYDPVYIEQELINTQIEEIVYISEVETQSLNGALEPDTDMYYFNPSEDDVLGNTVENYNELTSSLNQLSLIDTIVSSSDINLNVDYNQFENHVFFSSAKSKLKNFKTKLETLETYFSELSHSLSDTTGTGSIALDSESTYLRSRRQTLFSNINKEIASFTSYEKFLYFDGQLRTTSSAPGIGKNLANVYPVHKHSDVLDEQRSDKFNNLFGFPTVYKQSGSTDAYTYITHNNYRVENKPFFNYSGSVYMSFIVKGTHGIGGADGKLEHGNNNFIGYDDGNSVYQVPADCFGKGFIEAPVVTGSEWRRYIIEASQSYWRPTNVSGGPNANTVNMTNQNFAPGREEYEVLSGSNVSGSYPIQTHGVYTQLATYNTGSQIPFSGSILPAGDLFDVYWNGGTTAVSSSYITDFKITLKNPKQTYPFGNIYKTTSNDFINWYNSMYDAATQYDETNIHSLYNNLPEFFRNNENENKDLINFINMISEHFDLIRNYIDNYSLFYKRNYTKQQSVPNNLLPILADNLGWQLINPFTGSLGDYFGNVVGSDALQEGDDSIDDVKHNTWRKVLNNLIYIYKSKGTLNSVRALLNVYGYPADSLTIQEYGGNVQDTLTSSPSDIFNLTNFEPNTKNGMFDLSRNTGSINYVTTPEHLPGIVVKDKPFSIDWWQNNNDAEAIEFVFKKPNSISPQQVLFTASGSAYTGNPRFNWDLLLETGSSADLGRVRFRLSNQYTGSRYTGAASDLIESNAVSMSTNYVTMSDGSLWNVLLQRMTSSISGSGTNTYELHLGRQYNSVVKDYHYVTMSVSGGTAIDSNYRANQNWPSASTLEFGYQPSGGVTGFSGSISEFRTWNTPLSSSVFVEHVLNKRSVKGNTFDSYKNDLNIHFKFNEYSKAYPTGSNGKIETEWIIKDSNPKGPSSSPKDFSITRDVTLLTGVSGSLYDTTDINLYKISPYAAENTKNSNKITLDSITVPSKKLNPFNRSEKNVYQKDSTPKRDYSLKVDLSKSPSSIIDSFIYDKIGGFNIFDKINPSDVYEESYSNLDKLSKEFFDFYDFELKINQFIRKNSGRDQKELYRLVEKMLPSRATLDSGIVLKSHILDRVKFKHNHMSISTGSIYNMNLDINNQIIKSGSYISPYDGAINVSDMDNNSYITQSFSLLQPYETTYDVNKKIGIESNHFISYADILNIIDSGSKHSYVTQESSLIQPYNISISSLPVSESSLSQPYSKTIGVSDSVSTSYISQSYSLIQPYSISIDSLPTTGSSLLQPYTKVINSTDYISQSYSITQPYEKSISSLPTDTYSFSNPYDSAIVMITSGSNESVISQSYSLIQPYNIVINNLPISESSLKQPYNVTLSIIDSGSKNSVINQSYSLIQPYNKNISALPSQSFTHTTPYIGNISVHSMYGDVQPYHTSSNLTTIRDLWLDEFENIHDKWGRGDNDVHFIPLSKWDHKGGLANTTRDTSSNVAHQERRYTFSTIGDFETISASIDNVRKETNFSNIDMFKYQNFTGINKHNNFSISDENGVFKYDSFRTGDGNVKSTINGRPIGKTAFYATGSDGELVYPTNHWINFSNEFVNQMYEGTQFIGSQFFPHPEYEDLSTASFYTVNVTGTSRAIIKDGSVRKFGTKGRRNKK